MHAYLISTIRLGPTNPFSYLGLIAYLHGLPLIPNQRSLLCVLNSLLYFFKSLLLLLMIKEKNLGYIITVVLIFKITTSTYVCYSSLYVHVCVFVSEVIECVSLLGLCKKPCQAFRASAMVNYLASYF